MSRLRGRAIMRTLVLWLSTAIALVLVSLIPGLLTITTLSTALWAAVVISLIDALVWPIVLYFALPLTVLTLGLIVVAVNGIVLLLVSQFTPGFHVDGFWAGLAAALLVTIVNTVVASLLAIDDDGFWFRYVVGRYQRRAAPAADTDVPGLFFLEIDGLAHDILVRAMRDGNAPHLAKLVREGSHELTRWETDWSSQTGACQAGILHGSNADMPAFRWWEKDLGKAIVTNHPRDAQEIERRHSNGHGLLFDDGASRANIVSGDAPYSLLTMSTVLNRSRQGRLGRDYYAYFASPYNVVRTFVLAIRDIGRERRSAVNARRIDLQPRIERNRTYAMVRAWATVIQRDLQMYALIADIYAGRPIAYTTFLGYDEVAHHSGIERPETLEVLRDVDRHIDRLIRAAEHAPRPYQFVVLSDHGQSQGATFRERYGKTLEELVRELVSGTVAAEEGDPSEALEYIAATLSEVAAGDSAGATVVRRATRGRSSDGEVHLGSTVPQSGEELPDVVVLASGCLGSVSFPRQPGRLTLERIEELHPGLVVKLVEHPGIGFVLVRSQTRGALAIGADGVHELDTGTVEGLDPLLPFGERAAEHVARTDSFPHCPDLVINSTYWGQADEVAAFEELCGSHGGMGGTQSFPFVLHPKDLALPDDVVGAEALHDQLRGWLAALGHTAYADEGSVPEVAHTGEDHRSVGAIDGGDGL